MTILQELLAGTIGGAAQAVVGHPLDLIKVKMQAAPKTFPTLSSSVQNILRNEGAAGFFKGLSAPLLSCGLTNAALFTIYGTSKRVVASTAGADVTQLTLPQICLASMLSAPFYCSILTPVEVLKCNLQFGNTYNGPLQAVRNLGLRGLYQGYMPTLGTRLVGSPSYFMAYELTKRTLTDGDYVDNDSILIGLISGFCAGVAFWCAAFPIDLIKTRIQINTNPYMNTNPFNVAKQIVATESVVGLYRGFLPCILRSGPANAVAFCGFESTLSYMKKMEEREGELQYL